MHYGKLVGWYKKARKRTLFIRESVSSLDENSVSKLQSGKYINILNNNNNNKRNISWTIQVLYLKYAAGDTAQMSNVAHRRTQKKGDFVPQQLPAVQSHLLHLN